MPIEKSAGAVIFDKSDKEIEYLLIRSGWGRKYWGFVKGIIEKREKEKETVRREIKEEVDIDKIKFINGFKKWFKVFYKREGRNIFKIMTFYLVQAETKKVKLSWESIDYAWLTYRQALERLTFKDSKEILKKANDFLLSRPEGRGSPAKGAAKK